MQISAREAATILAVLGLGREQARRVLGAGVAGPGTLAGGVRLYDAAAVHRLLERPILTAVDLDPACREEMFVARVSPKVAAGGMAAIRSGWRLSPYARLRIRLRIERDGFMPLVATVCGFVVLGANMVAARPDQADRPTAHLSDGRSVIDLDPPGRWFEPMREARFVTGPGSPWTLWSETRGQRTW